MSIGLLGFAVTAARVCGEDSCLPPCRSEVLVVGGVSQVLLRRGFAFLMTRPIGVLEAESFDSVPFGFFVFAFGGRHILLKYVFLVFVCAFSKFHFIMIDWIMNMFWFCPHVFCVFSLSSAHA